MPDVSMVLTFFFLPKLSHELSQAAATPIIESPLAVVYYIRSLFSLPLHVINTPHLWLCPLLTWGAKPFFPSELTMQKIPQTQVILYNDLLFLN
ncbi:hypothetical protein QBC46DRAFT_97121 [Diplogelasinospora grovesii]|uniref:Uncharacterized protein n=1 Tax=Diplogelasinospora grovesii TaxID=303347 RepID=A0AAN6SAE6_9PEZI|nr:hypothetical protein QBC46DRAFT_97121 [Diplogelasinospora grovesii]